MKNIFLTIVFIILMQEFGYTQTTDSCFAGVYLDLTDFIQNKVTNKINVNKKGNDIKIKMTNIVKIITSDKVIKYKVGSIYGYYLCGNKYRYSSKSEIKAPEDFYKVEEIKGLIIYTSVFWGGAEYFYSLNISSPIHRLNMNNLQKDFSENSEFISEIKKAKLFDGLSTKNDKSEFVINLIYDKILKK